MSYEADQSAYQTWTLGFSLIENGKYGDIEKSLETVNNAITNPEAPKASLIPWLG